MPESPPPTCGLRRPTLDEVFLRLTDQQGDPSDDRPHLASSGRLRWTLTDGLTLIGRELDGCGKNPGRSSPR